MDPGSLRIGIGHDTHRLIDGGPLMIGGVSIPHSRKAEGHSDADVLLHATIDAVLGAAHLGDIGQMFPNTDESNRDRDSAEMLKIAWHKVVESGFSLINLDSVVFAERPKMIPFREAICKNIADILGVDESLIGFKAKTGESVDAVGHELAIQAQVVALLCKKETPA